MLTMIPIFEESATGKTAGVLPVFRSGTVCDGAERVGSAIVYRPKDVDGFPPAAMKSPPKNSSLCFSAMATRNADAPLSS